jgi:nodulation protein E
MKRVAITGAGTINPLGMSPAETFEAFKSGRCAIGRLRITGAERLAQPIGAQVRGFDPGLQAPAEAHAHRDRFAQFACFAARQALQSSGVVLDEALAQRAGVILGTAGGGVATQDEAYHRLYAENQLRVAPLTVPRVMHNAAASHVSSDLGLHGPAFSVSSACASSNHAMGLAFQMVRSGATPMMLAGGSEAMLTLGGLKAWEGLRVMSPDGCRPFCASRNGMVMGEGAAVYVFEEWDHASARGADILAEVAGFSMGADAGDLVKPSAAGAVRAIEGALRDGALDRAATRLNDRTECAALQTVFGPGAGRVPISSTKSMHGHLIGAAGAVELLACILALREGVIAPTMGYRAADPDCPLDVVPNQARTAAVAATLSNAFAFGGLNAVIALRRA